MTGQLHQSDNSTESAHSPQPVPLSLPRYSFEELAPDSSQEILAAARELLLEYREFLAAQPGSASFCLGALEREAADLPQSYLDQGGGAIVASLATNPVQNANPVQDANPVQQPIGFVAWRLLPVPELTTAWELKRLWTRPEARGSGIGRALVEVVLDRARAANKTAILLDTVPAVMATAYRLYQQMGFVECPPYNGRPAAGIVYMSKTL
jgi:putative acetyltransferase